jgi:uncharacterized protein (TIGR03084 family)
VREILSDLVAEQQALDQFLQRAPNRDWQAKVRNGKTVKDLVAGLAAAEELVRDALEGGGELLDEAHREGMEPAIRARAKRGDTMRWQDVIEWWREARARVVEALSRMDGDEQIRWLDGNLDSRRIAAARLRDTWAHALDIEGTLRGEPEDTARLRHVAWAGWAELPAVFHAAGETYAEEVRLEVMGPGYAKWVWGPEGSEQLIKGPAGEWSRLVVGRVPPGALSLKVEGDVAEAAVRILGKRR